MNKQLFEESDDSENNSNFQLNTNEKYIKSYNDLRRKELLQKLKKKDDAAVSSSDSSSDSSEDENFSDPTFDEQFFKTLAYLKSRNPKIYDKNTIFFTNEPNKSVKNTKGDSKPLMLKDYERQIILSKGGKFEDESDDEKQTSGTKTVPHSIVEEEQLIKEEFHKAINALDEDASCDEEFGGIFRKRSKTKEEIKKEEDDYLSWLSGKQEALNESLKEQLKPLKNYWNDSNLSKSEKFLRDYILNKGYTEASNYSEIPTYDEIIGDNNVPLEEDEVELEKQEEFEHKYNFRFQEPDQDFIKRYPRVIGSSVRRSDDKRKEKRQEIKNRKQQEKEQKLKELEMVKEMKRKEIEEKIRKLKLITGNDELAFDENEFDEDFDPEVHDKRMQEIFNDHYYQENQDEEKPECPSDVEELKFFDWDSYDPNKDANDEVYDNDYTYDEQNYDDDEDFNMDCDYDPQQAKEQLQKELIENTKGRRRRRKNRRNRFLDVIKAEKPVFNPDDEKTYAEYIDEYYKLDCEDIIDDIPCRFKYVETTPNDFGLTVEEILMAKNKELNQWASLKKAIQIRPDHLEKRDYRLYKLKAKNMELKKKIFKSIYGDGSDIEENGEDEKQNNEKNQTTNEKECNIKMQDDNRDKKRKHKNNEKMENVEQNVNNKKLKLEQNNTHGKNIINRGKKMGKLQDQSANVEKNNKIKKDEQVTSKALNEKPSNKNNVLKNLKGKKMNTKNKQPITSATNKVEITDERLKAYGINPKKFYKKFHSKKEKGKKVKKNNNSGNNL